MRTLLGLQPRAHFIDDRVVEVVELGAVGQRQLSERVQGLALGQVVLRLVVELGRRTHADFRMHLAQAAQHRGLVLAWRGYRAGRRSLDLADVDHEHGVVRGQRAARFGQHVRMRQIVLGTGLGKRADHVGGVLVEAIVDRAFRARARALVVDTEASADVHVADRQAELGQLDEIAHGFAHAARDVAHVGHLRTHVEVQQLERVRKPGGLQLVDQGQQLARGEAELGLVAAGVLPLAGAEAFQPHAHAEQRLDAERLRLLDDETQLGGLLDDDEDLQAELASDQGQANVFAILVAIADDHAAAPRQREHGHQLGFRTGLESESGTAASGKLAGDVLLLVDLDRIDGRIAARIVPGRHGPGEGGLQARAAIVEYVGKAHQQRQA